MKRIFLTILVCFLTQISLVKAQNMVSIKFNITPLMSAVKQDDEKAAEIFLKSGSNPNEENEANVTALHIAATNNSLKSAKLLIDYKANINKGDDEGFTPLMRACSHKHCKFAKLLIDNKAKLWELNTFNESALLLATSVDAADCVKAIIDATPKDQIDNKIISEQVKQSLEIVYKKQNKEVETLLNDFYASVIDVRSKDKLSKEIKKLEDRHKKIVEKETKIENQISDKKNKKKAANDAKNTSKQEEKSGNIFTNLFK